MILTLLKWSALVTTSAAGTVGACVYVLLVYSHL
jgi:hypothetical protein